MQSLDKLREYGHDCCARIDDAIHDYCDEIEAEIAERYMELPVDTDGVPVKLGDTIGKVDNCDHYTFTVEGYTSVLPDGIGELMLVDEHDDCWYPKNCIHVKPRTIEDVLLDVMNEFASSPDGETPASIAAEYADELRSMGVGE